MSHTYMTGFKVFRGYDKNNHYSPNETTENSKHLAYIFYLDKNHIMYTNLNANLLAISG